jgi:hypothetical protein
MVTTEAALGEICISSIMAGTGGQNMYVLDHAFLTGSVAVFDVKGNTMSFAPRADTVKPAGYTAAEWDSDGVRARADEQRYE